MSVLELLFSSEMLELMMQIPVERQRSFCVRVRVMHNVEILLITIILIKN